MSDPLAEEEADDKNLRKAVKDAEKAREKTKSEKEAKPHQSAKAKAFTSTTTSMPSR